MAALRVVVREEPVRVTLDLRHLDVPRGPAGNPEALVERRPVHALHEAVGARRTDLGGATARSSRRDGSMDLRMFQGVVTSGSRR
jgi:hypothetical protein